MTRFTILLAAGVTALAGCAGPDDTTAPGLQTLTVVGAGNGAGAVTSNPVGVNCSSPGCSASFAGGTTVTLQAVANPGSLFAGWSGGGCSGTATCVVMVNSAVTVTATF